MGKLSDWGGRWRGKKKRNQLVEEAERIGKNAFLSLQELNIGRKTSKAIKISGWLARVGLIYCTYSVVDKAGVKVWSALPSGPDWTRSWWAFHRDPGPCHLEKPKSVFMPHRSTASSRQVSNGLQLQKVPVMCLGCFFFLSVGSFHLTKMENHLVSSNVWVHCGGQTMCGSKF